MKPRTLIWLILGLVCLTIAAATFWCNPRFTHAHNAIVTDATQFIKGSPPEQINGLFTSSATYSDEYDSITYVTAQGRLTVANNRSASYIVGRYDLQTKQLLWIAVGIGSGDGRACASTVLAPPENAVYVLGYFSNETEFVSSYNPSTINRATSQGKTDLILAKYDYETGRQYWTNAGGGTGNDLGYMYTKSGGTFMHDESCMRCDSVGPLLRLWARCWGDSVGFVNAPGSADDRIVAVDTTRFVKITLDRGSGLVTELGIDSVMPR